MQPGHPDFLQRSFQYARAFEAVSLSFDYSPHLCYNTMMEAEVNVRAGKVNDMNKKKNDSFVSIKSFVMALVIIGVLMVCAYAAALLVPCEGIPFWKWVLSPVLVLTSDDKVTLLAVIFFLLIIGGIFNALTNGGVMKYMLDLIAAKYSGRKYTLMAVIMLFFMAMGSLIGSFEEVVPMVPIVTALAVRLGWDPLTGMAMSLLSVGCGFSAGIFNPFTVGICQELAGLPMFSGALIRTFNFICIYALLLLFTRTHAKKIDKGNAADDGSGFVRDEKKEKAAIRFAVILGIGLAAVMSSALIEALRDYTFVAVSLMFLIAGIVSCRTAGMSRKELGKYFVSGLVSMLPAVLMILMASSIKYTLQTAGVLEVLIAGAIDMAGKLPGWSVILFIYLLVLLMNFFISSGSAKAVMLTPIIVPLAQAYGVSPQIAICAFAFGDGFSNTFYPTNPALLISLGLSDTGYADWFRYSGKFQLMNLLLTSLLLLLGI